MYYHPPLKYNLRPRSTRNTLDPFILLRFVNFSLPRRVVRRDKGGSGTSASLVAYSKLSTPRYSNQNTCLGSSISAFYHLYGRATPNAPGLPHTKSYGYYNTHYNLHCGPQQHSHNIVWSIACTILFRGLFTVWFGLSKEYIWKWPPYITLTCTVSSNAQLP